VEIPAFRFDPDPVRIKAGTAVVWHNAHDQAHTSTGAGAMPWNTGTLAPGRASAPVTFAKPGTYPYICALHPFMKGTVEVQA
jgi:plastocyanin